MTRTLFITLTACLLSLTSIAQDSLTVDYDGFLAMTEEVESYRQSRLIPIGAWNAMSKQPNTIILDTRSKKAYDAIHIRGAVHLNFSDFTKETLAEAIPSKDTRILIYCNNNVISNNAMFFNKFTPLALNIPTFINLYGYGYTNIYELADYLPEGAPRFDFVRGE